jgi:hypothetical protein
MEVSHNVDKLQMFDKLVKFIDHQWFSVRLGIWLPTAAAEEDAPYSDGAPRQATEYQRDPSRAAQKKSGATCVAPLSLSIPSYST